MSFNEKIDNAKIESGKTDHTRTDVNQTGRATNGVKLKTNEEIRSIIDRWCSTSINNSPISKNTDVYNYFLEIKETLLNELTK